ncbi:MAG TPA: GAF and ANTAR domain-containing protein [Acidimicrobiales bacterium]|nr:GAF and ANTAR domain-containing protein [Acidimicrobiales bacterium]
MNGTAERRARILVMLARAGHPVQTKSLCRVSAEVTGATGAGIMLMSGNTPGGSLCTTNEMSDVIEQLQYALGEGPCVDAYQQDTPVLEADLANARTRRWPAFSPPALRAGVAAVFGFPLHIGATRLGALNLCRDSAGSLDQQQYADALVMADIVAESILIFQSKAGPGGEVAAELEEAADFHWVVHQASGMVAAQLGIGIGHALARLRGYAFANERLLADVAKDVVARRLRLSADEMGGT